MTLSIRSNVFAVCVASLALGFTPSATANSQAITAVNQKHVQVSDLNLANPAGLDALYQRLRGAARDVCGSYSDLKSAGSVKQLRANKTCFDRTLATALADVNYPSASQAHAY